MSVVGPNTVSFNAMSANTIRSMLGSVTARHKRYGLLPRRLVVITTLHGAALLMDLVSVITVMLNASLVLLSSLIFITF